MEQIHYHEAKEEFEKIAPNIDDAEILSDYGKVYYILGEYDKAIAYYEKDLKITLATLGEKHPSTATSYNNIGGAWDSKGEYDKAIEYYEKALYIFHGVFPNGHPNISVIEGNLNSAKESLKNESK